MTTRHGAPNYAGFLAHRSPAGAHLWTMGRTTAAWTADTLRAAPFPVGRPMLIDAISIEVTGAGGAGVNCLLAVYADNGSGHPGELVAGTVSAEMDVSTTGLKRTTFTPVLLAGRSLYWVAIAQESGTQPSYRTSNPPSMAELLIGLPDNTAPGTGPLGCWHVARTYDATMPQTFPAATRNGAFSPIIMLETP